MSDAQGYDPKNLEVLRSDLKGLRAKARETGVLKPSGSNGARSRSGPAASRRAAVLEAGGPAERGKQMASSMLSLLRSGDEVGSPKVPGTNFTEHGLQQLLDQLVAPKKQPGPAAAKLLGRMNGFLNTPGPSTSQTVAGVSVEKVRLLGRMLEQIEKHGWDQVRLIQAKRSEKKAKAKPKPAPKPAPEPATPLKRKLLRRRTAS